MVVRHGRPFFHKDSNIESTLLLFNREVKGFGSGSFI